MKRNIGRAVKRTDLLVVKRMQTKEAEGTKILGNFEGVWVTWSHENWILLGFTEISPASAEHWFWCINDQVIGVT